MTSVGRRVPIATIGVFIATAAVTAWQLADPRVLDALRRSPERLAAGEWWRLVTPLLVHADGPRQMVVNAAALLTLGPLIEWRTGARAWLALYAVAALAGELSGYAWDPYGAGASVGICGLLAALAVWLLRAPLLRARIGGMLVVALGLALTVMRDIHGPALLAGCTMAVLLGTPVPHPPGALPPKLEP